MNNITLTTALVWRGLIIASIAGWITHIIHCFQNEQYVLLLVGAIAAPLGSLHGIGLWFGWR